MPWYARRSLVIRPFDRRIHFALNCGATSCPPIRRYIAEGVDSELRSVAESFFVSGGIRIDDERGDVVMSRLLLWYARDSGWSERKQSASVEEFLDDEARNDVRQAAKVPIRYEDSDWCAPDITR